ncbi:protein kinase domain-containing protein [Cecembia calidifontis]|uniref:Serine/threonine-protein kinase 24/25/MST4 n=1 Tax=Cecembia calidifontis TaxID=1187080 RepID=A0A4Q7P7I6_9BACT|nr:protein kinase [Cecembia calidifontis]RZS96103.1 serine/threonine-protein kinase 24/25/MST4 [Cecembia calidifontis]
MKKIVKKLIPIDQWDAIDKNIIGIVSKLDHPNINPVISIHLNPEVGNPYLQSPWCNLGSLNDFIEKHKISLQLLNKLIFQTLSGLAYLHSLNLVHSDLKLSNILMHKENESIDFKIGDLLTLKKESSGIELNGGFYTPEILAPEVYLSQKVTSKMDIWALGVMLYILFTKQYPFGDRRTSSIAEVKNNIVTGNIKGPAFDTFPEPFGQFIEMCLAHDPYLRPSPSEILKMIE